MTKAVLPIEFECAGAATLRATYDFDQALAYVFAGQPRGKLLALQLARIWFADADEATTFRKASIVADRWEIARRIRKNRSAA